MKEIILTQNQIALVDNDIYEELNKFKWYAIKFKHTFYARRSSTRINGKQHTIRMHNEIMGKLPKGLEIDHRDGNGLNNQRENLRFVTRRQNCQNKQNVETSSKYPGVYWCKPTKKWVAKININGKYNYIGHFLDEKEAFEAYRQAVNAIGEEVLEDFRYA